MADVVFNNIPKDDSLNHVCKLYNVDEEILCTQKKIDIRYEKEKTETAHNSAVSLAEILWGNNLCVCCQNSIGLNLATSPAISCSVDRSLSGLRRLKMQLRSTMGQEILSSVVLMTIERKYSNEMFEHDIDIETFHQYINIQLSF